MSSDPKSYMDQRAIDMQQSNTCGELMLADLSALVPKPVLLCAKDRANFVGE